MVAFIDAHRDQYGVEPICAELPIASSTYYAWRAVARDPTRRAARAQRDAALTRVIRAAWTASGGRYGSRKVWYAVQRCIYHAPR